MIGVLAIIAILAVIIVPKVFATIASSRVTSAVASVNAMKTAVTDFAGKYGTIPVSPNTARIDDLLVTAGMLDTRFTVKIGNQPTNPPRAGGTWSNATGTWAATGGTNQQTAPIQSRIQAVASVATATPGAGTNYRLDGTTNLPAGATVVSALIAGVNINDARDLSQKIDGDTMTQALSSTAADVAGKVTYNAPNANGITNVYIYIAHQ
jgi:type II secretory pathway pseudopilin PulG